MSTQDLEQLYGEKIGPKVEMILVADRLFGRRDGGWFEYPPYPEPPDDA